MSHKPTDPLDLEELKRNTESTLYDWMLYSSDDLGEGQAFSLFTNHLRELLSKSPADGVDFVERAITYAFGHTKRRRLYIAASNLTAMLYASRTFDMFKSKNDGTYRLAVMFALAVQNLDRYDKSSVATYEDALRLLTGTDFTFVRNYNKHREQAFTALFGPAWTALYIDDLIGPNAVLSTLLQARAPLVFLDSPTQKVNLPVDISLD